MGEGEEQRWPLVLDLVSAKALVWIATRSPHASLTSEAHRFFADRYGRLAAWHRRHGHVHRARQLQRKAADHWQVSGGDGPPYAAAMALPRPNAWVATDAVGRFRSGGGPDAA